MYLQWIIDVWSAVSSDVVYNSFQCCGITLKTDGSEDGEIPVFKPDGPCPDWKQVFEDRTSEIHFNSAVTGALGDIHSVSDSEELMVPASDDFEDQELSIKLVL